MNPDQNQQNIANQPAPQVDTQVFNNNVNNSNHQNKSRSNILKYFFTLFLTLLTIFVLSVILFIFLNYLNIISLTKISPIFKSLPKNSTNLDQYNITNTNQYFINSAVFEDFNNNIIKIRLSDKTTLTIPYDNSSTFYDYKSTTNAQIQFPENILKKANIGKPVNVYILNNNRKLLLKEFDLYSN